MHHLICFVFFFTKIEYALAVCLYNEPHVYLMCVLSSIDIFVSVQHSCTAQHRFLHVMSRPVFALK